MAIEKIYIDKTLSVKQIEQKYSIHLRTSYRVKKRGYIIKKTKTINISRKDFDYNKAKKASAYTYFYKIKQIVPCHFLSLNNFYDDLQQEGIIRCFELSGETRKDKNNNKFGYYCKIAEYAMYSFLKKVHMLGSYNNKTVSFEENISGHGIYEI